MLLRPGDVLEDWICLDIKVAGEYVIDGKQGQLIWALLPDEEEPRGRWKPLLIGPGNLILECPIWAPLPGSQMQFLSSPIFETILEGNRGGGKSELLLMDFARDVGRGFGSAWRGILFRQQLGDLDEMVRKAESLFKPLYGDDFRFLKSKADYAAVWKSGESLLFRHMLDESEYKEYHGHQYPWIGWEELTQWMDLKAYLLMFSCCRPTAPGIPIRVRANTNPSGPGHHAVKKRFRLPEMRGRVIRVPGEEARVAINSKLEENFILLHTDPNYGQRIVQAATSQAQKDAWSKGDWNVTEGGMVDDVWDQGVHVIPDLMGMRIPLSWRICRTYDHGQARPFWCGWFAESSGEAIILPDGRRIGQVRGDLVLFMEWYGLKPGEDDVGIAMRASSIAKGMLERDRDVGVAGRVVSGAADTEIWSKDNRGLGRAPIDDFESEGVFFDQADKSPGSRKRGWGLLREYLEGAKLGKDGTREKPGLFICRRCKHWLALVPTMPRSPKDPDDIPDKYEDHPADGTRYRLTWVFKGMSRRSF